MAARLQLMLSAPTPSVIVADKLGSVSQAAQICPKNSAAERAENRGRNSRGESDSDAAGYGAYRHADNCKRQGGDRCDASVVCGGH